MIVNIKYFDMRTIKANRCWLIIGPRGTGKSLFEEDLLMHLSSFIDIPIGMTPSEASLEMLERHFPPGFIFNTGFDKEVVSRMVQLAKALRKGKKRKQMLLLLDDCMFDKNAFRGQPMREIALNGRQFDFNFVNSAQYLMDMERDIRSQQDYVVVLKESNIGNLQRLHVNFFSMFSKFDDFLKVFQQCTQNHCALVLDRTQDMTDINKCLFWYKVPWVRTIPNPKKPEDTIVDPACYPMFTIGNSCYWQLSFEYEAPEEDASQELLKPKTFGPQLPDNTPKKVSNRVEQVICDPTTAAETKHSTGSVGGNSSSPQVAVIEIPPEEEALPGYGAAAGYDPSANWSNWSNLSNLSNWSNCQPSSLSQQPSIYSQYSQSDSQYSQSLPSRATLSSGSYYHPSVNFHSYTSSYPMVQVGGH